LINHGADVNIVFKNGSTPLSWALQKGNTKSVEVLKKARAKK
jgi:ankyrin repeat protein